MEQTEQVQIKMEQIEHLFQILGLKISKITIFSYVLMQN